MKYMVEHIDLMPAVMIGEHLTRMSSQGWELVTVYPDADFLAAVFKRYAPLPEPKTEVQEVKDLFGNLESI